MNDCDHISDKCLKWIASSCTQLTHLNLRFCTRISNGGLYDLSLGVQNFKTLKLSHCPQLTDASIIFFSDNIKDLRNMYLRRCRKITENSAQYLVKNCPFLTILDLTGCPNVSLSSKKSLEASVKNRKLQLRVDIPRQERGVLSPTERGSYVAYEVPIHKKFTSGPKDIMSGKKVVNALKTLAEGGSHSPKEGKKKKSHGSKSSMVMID